MKRDEILRDADLISDCQSKQFQGIIDVFNVRIVCYFKHKKYVLKRNIVTCCF